MAATYRLVAYGGGHGRSPSSGEIQGNKGEVAVGVPCCRFLGRTRRLLQGEPVVFPILGFSSGF